MRHLLFAAGTLVAATPCIAQSCPTDLAVNGSFEQGPPIPGGFIGLNPNTTTLVGWTITRSVEYIGSLWQHADGRRSIDLNESVPGGIAQRLTTVAGDHYAVVFAMAGNPDGAPVTKTLSVSAAGQSATFTAVRNTRGNMGWSTRVWHFVADATTTTLAFDSLTSGPYGPTLDLVRVHDATPTRLGQATPTPAGGRIDVTGGLSISTATPLAIELSGANSGAAVALLVNPEALSSTWVLSGVTLWVGTAPIVLPLGSTGASGDASWSTTLGPLDSASLGQRVRAQWLSLHAAVLFGSDALAVPIGC